MKDNEIISKELLLLTEGHLDMFLDYMVDNAHEYPVYEDDEIPYLDDSEANWQIRAIMVDALSSSISLALDRKSIQDKLEDACSNLLTNEEAATIVKELLYFNLTEGN